MKKRNVIIDCDPGVDDAVMLALAAAHREELEILGITTVSGNQDIKKVTANALNLAEFYGLSVPVARGMEKPVMRKTYFAPETHGESGIGNCVLPCSGKAPEPEKGIFFIRRVLGELPEGRAGNDHCHRPSDKYCFSSEDFSGSKRKDTGDRFYGAVPCQEETLQMRQNLIFLQTPRLRIWFCTREFLLLCAVWM